MTVAVLSIGTELTRGELINTNATWLSEELTKLGFEVVEHHTVDDHPERIVQALLALGSSHEVIVATGGLGPTSDDLTTEAAAKAAGVELVRDERSLQELREKFAAYGFKMPEENAKQADFPKGSTILPNPVGTAPGFSLELTGARCFFTPGVPREMKHIFRESITPAIADLADRRTHQVHIRTFGLTESGVAQRLRELESKHEGLVIGYRAHFPEIEVKLNVLADSTTKAADRADEIAAEARQLLGDAVFGAKDDTFASVIGTSLREQGLTLAVAESCTGGRIGAMLTAVPGSSDYFVLDAVAYANSAKEKVLGVHPEVLRAHGAVSSETVTAMAEGALRVAETDIAVSVTGVAGPDGGTDEKPVGTVWFGLARKGLPTVTRHRQLPGDRERVQVLSAYIALELVRRAVSGRDFDFPR